MYNYQAEENNRAMTKTARTLGEKIAKKYCELAPVDVEHIIRQHGFLLSKLELPESISGYADLDSQEIFINKNKPHVHQRFTMAHELGHFVLKHKKRKWTEYASPHETTPDKPLEEEANAFASGLLMPSFLVKPLFQRMKPKDMYPLLEVSESALWIALQTYRLV